MSTASPADRWRSARVSTAAIPSGGSTGSARPVVLAQGSDELVDLAECLARHILDRLQSDSCAPGIACAEQSRRPGLDEDHVDRVASGVVEIASDAHAFLGHGETLLALGFPRGSACAVLELGDLLAPLPHAVPDHPRPTPDENAEEEWNGRERAVGDADRSGMNDEHRRDDRPCEPPRAPCLLGAEREEEHGDGRAERRTWWIVEHVQQRTRRGGHDEDCQGHPAAHDER